MAKKQPWEMDIIEESGIGGKDWKKEAFRKGFLKSENSTAVETS